MARIPLKEVGWKHEIEAPPEGSLAEMWTVWGRWGAFTRGALERQTEKGWHNNCIAVPLDEYGDPLWQGDTEMADCVAAVHGTSNSPVHSTSHSRDYLRKRCVRVSEELARCLHPKLFHYLEQK